MANPVGFAMDFITVSFKADDAGHGACSIKAAQILVAEDEGFREIVYDSGMSEAVDSIAHRVPLVCRPAARYYWKVKAVADNGSEAESGTAFFETCAAKEKITARMITSESGLDTCEFFKTVRLDGQVKQARAYAAALGIFELWIDGNRVGKEYLTPYCNDYDTWNQIITFDVTDYLQISASGKSDGKMEHELTVAAAPGWYAGYFGFEGKNHIYGAHTAALLQIDVTYEDGTRDSYVTDESWSVRESKIRAAELYHGEVYDASFLPGKAGGVRIAEFDKNRLEPRRSLPVVVKETVKPKRIIHTPAGETVLDMGQNMVGWVAFGCREAAGTKIFMQYGEVLQQGNFYRDNLRTARAEFTYLSDGNERLVRPHFTFYGFRYVKVEGITELCLDDFTGEVLYSDMEVTGNVQTSNPLVNRLFLNALWGQKGNFIDIPTDCPQRDERMGWTGDAEVFSGTALFNMDVSAFYAKYGYDMTKEQKKAKGCVPMVVPSFKMTGGGASAWADAATVIPWNTYVYTGDASILEQQYPSMKMWADYIYRQDMENGGKGLWQSGFHFGDWLALDGTDPKFPTGATELFYIASGYYYLSTVLTQKAAEVLGRTADAAVYGKRAEKIKKAIRDEYFTANGKLAVPTQTGYVLALAFGFCPPEYRERAAADLNARIEKDGGVLKTGFVGTPYICKALSEYGYNETAYRLLLNEDCPGWLYPVRMGATTIWERWNSILPDGTMNPEGMNSLNHYAYGSIAEWMYRYIGGINPMEATPGFREIRLAPKPDFRMSRAEVSFQSPVGLYESAWEIKDQAYFFRFTVPFGGLAHVSLPDAPEYVDLDGKEVRAADMKLHAGRYRISYHPNVPEDRFEIKPDRIPGMLMDI